MKECKCKTCRRTIHGDNFFTLFGHHTKEVWHICPECSTNVLRLGASVFKQNQLVHRKVVRNKDNGRKHVIEVWQLPQ